MFHTCIPDTLLNLMIQMKKLVIVYVELWTGCQRILRTYLVNILSSGVSDQPGPEIIKLQLSLKFHPRV